VAQLGARLDGIEEVVGSNPIGSTKNFFVSIPTKKDPTKKEKFSEVAAILRRDAAVLRPDMVYAKATSVSDGGSL
jgi:hypothetical protein